MAEQKLIENQIHDVLSGDAEKNALNLIAFLNESKLALKANGNNEEWVVDEIDGNSMGFILINGDSQAPGPWTIWFNSCDFCDGTVDDEVKGTAWHHASTCAHCHEGWASCGSGDRYIFGREFENLCHSPLMFTNPDANTLENMKKLISMIK